MLIIHKRKRSSALLLPALATAVTGHDLGGALTAGAAGFAIVQDTSATSMPALLSGFTSLLAQSNAAGDNDTHMRVSFKVVASGETIPAASGTPSRRTLRIYSNVDASNPVADVQGAGGTGAAIAVPALTIPDGGRLVVGFLRRSGAALLAFGAPLDANAYTQNTSAIAHSAESAGLLTSYAGQTLTGGASTDWVTAVLALNGAAA